MPEDLTAPIPTLKGEDTERTFKRVQLTQDIMMRFGLTRSCPGCTDISNGQGGKRGAAKHNEMCRTRIEKKLRDEGNIKVANADLRRGQRSKGIREAS